MIRSCLNCKWGRPKATYTFVVCVRYPKFVIKPTPAWCGEYVPDPEKEERQENAPEQESSAQNV